MNPDASSPTPLPAKEKIIPLILALRQQAENDTDIRMREVHRKQAEQLMNANKISEDDVNLYLLRNS